MIADYGTGDPYFAEVIHRLKDLDPDVEIQPTSVPAFSTIGTGFWIAQYGLYNPAFDDVAIYANTAPRRKKEYDHNRGEELLYARLDNGIPVLAVNSGYSLAFVRDHITEARRVPIDKAGSPFRSRDYFPEVVHSVLDGDLSVLGDAVPTSSIPDPPGDCVVWIDGFGNIKTNIRASAVDLDAGQELALGIGDGKMEATYVQNAFDVDEDALAFAPGSSGGDDPFMEIILRGGAAAEYFHEPGIGDDVVYAERSKDVNEVLQD